MGLEGYRVEVRQGLYASGYGGVVEQGSSGLMESEMTVIFPCEQCGGTGRIIKARCPTCGGRGYLSSSDSPPPVSRDQGANRRKDSPATADRKTTKETPS